MSVSKKLVSVLVFVFLSVSASQPFAKERSAQKPDMFDMTLEELMDITMTVGSRRAANINDTPGIVTLITAEQIEALGARDLIDILRHVPGFDFEWDISGVVGLGIRGNWAQEGKVLVLIDGIEMNDDMYASFEYGQHIPVDVIERIEIIRGPGSVMYGGAAELGVISITTKSPQKAHDLQVDVAAGRMKDAWGRAYGTLFYGGSPNDDLSYSIAAHYGWGNLSDRTATDLWGYSYDMADDANSQISSLFLNGSARFRDLNLRLIIDRYETRYSYPYPYYSISDYKIDFNSYLGQLSYDWAILENLTLTPRFQFKVQQPWKNPKIFDDNGTRQPWYENDVQSEKYTGEVTLAWDITERYNVRAGLIYDFLKGTDRTKTGNLGGKNSISYHDFAVYLEGLLRPVWFDTHIANFTAGLRMNYHEEFGMYVVPRFAVTREFDAGAFGTYHVKGLISRAVREPKLMNIAINDTLDPELTTVFEVEVGATWFDMLFLAANFYHAKIKDAIVYTYLGSSTYENAGDTGTEGVEVVAKLNWERIEADLSYSFYRSIKNEVQEYAVPDSHDVHLSLPAHKVAGKLSVNPWKSLFITPSVVWMSSKHAITGSDVSWSVYYGELDSSVLFDLTLLYEDAFVDGLDITLAVHNITDENFMFSEPYPGYDWPTPGPSREYMLKVGYSF